MLSSATMLRLATPLRFNMGKCTPESGESWQHVHCSQPIVFLYRVVSRVEDNSPAVKTEIPRQWKLVIKIAKILFKLFGHVYVWPPECKVCRSSSSIFDCIPPHLLFPICYKPSVICDTAFIVMPRLCDALSLSLLSTSLLSHDRAACDCLHVHRRRRCRLSSGAALHEVIYIR